MWIGQPVLAVAAETETIAQDAIDLIKVDFEELPFTVDPLQSLFPGGPDARTDGNAVDNRLIGPPQLKQVKWTAGDFARSEEGQLPMGEPLVEWSYGDVDAGFAKATLVLDETFVTAGMSHHSMEPRSAMAYWENGKCFVYGSTQSQSFVVPGLANLIGITPERARLCRRDLRRRLRLEGHRISRDGDPGAHVEEDRPARDAAHHARRGVLLRLRAHGLPGPHPHGLRPARPRHGRRSLHRARERRDGGFPRLAVVGRDRFDPLSARSDALPRHVRHDEHRAALGAARPRPQPDRVGHRAADRQSREAARDRSARDSPLERPAHGREGRREPRPRHELLSAGSVRQGRDALQLRGAQRAQRPAQRHEGHGHRRRPGVPSGRLRGLRRPRAHHDGRQAALAQRRRQSRHVLAHGHVAHRGRGAEGELGQLHRRARRHAQGLALEHRPVRQQHVVHDGAHELRRGDGCARQAQGDRRDGLGRRAGRLRRRRRARVLEERHDERASRTRKPRSAPSRSAASSTATRTRPTSIR